MNRIIFDVREAHEFHAGRVDNARNLPVTQLTSQPPKQLEAVTRDTQIILYCRSGGRSAVAKNIIESYGFRNVINGINKQQVEATYL